MFLNLRLTPKYMLCRRSFRKESTQSFNTLRTNITAKKQLCQLATSLLLFLGKYSSQT